MAKLMTHHALVTYDQLRVSAEADAAHLQEWFALPGPPRAGKAAEAKRLAGSQGGGAEVMGPGSLLRPAPPLEVRDTR